MLRPLFTLVAVALAVSPAVAQRPRVKVTDARIGFPPGKFAGELDDSARTAHVLKNNVWAPAYVSLEMLREYTDKEPIRLKIDAVDADGLKTTSVIPAAGLAGRNPGESIRPDEFPYTPYVRYGDRNNAEITFTILAGDDAISEPFRVRYPRGRDGNSYVVLGLGSRLPEFGLPTEANQANPQAVGQKALRNGRVETAAYTSVADMPDQWFGYAAADLVVLTTGSANDQFLKALFADDATATEKAKRAALLEWVRRGGKLVVSVGSNAPLLSQYPGFAEFLPAKLKADAPAVQVKQLNLRWKLNSPFDVYLEPKTDTFAVAQLGTPTGRRPRSLIPSPAANRVPDPAERPAVLQTPVGLGRITVVLFDLDRSPFVDFSRRAEFWDWLLRTAGAEKASVGDSKTQQNFTGYGDQEDEFTSALRVHVDTFDGVPVISFGWVALFIALYTLLIGPVEYLFLKKVLGRLELTWVTFPLIVLSVSAAAYVTAYAIKGNDLKVNKIDVVDVDPAGGRVYGRSWFTVFSPRIDSYTVGVSPADGWTTPRGAGNPAPLVDWMAGSRGGGGSIVSRGYRYATSDQGDRLATGLVGVPIQVWSTKAFAANWSGYTDPAAPLVESRLSHPPSDARVLQGTIVNRLPVKELKDAVLYYGGEAYKLPVLTPGREITVVLDSTLTDAGWLANNARLEQVGFLTGRDNFNYGRQPQVTTSQLSLWGALFHERAATKQGKPLQNGTLRELDASWRLDDKDPRFFDEAILVAKVEPANGPAEGIMTDPAGPSPTHLWLKALPGGTEPRPPVPGTLRQETYIRAYLPVKPTGR